jgi:hypothetical protein
MLHLLGLPLVLRVAFESFSVRMVVLGLWVVGFFFWSWAISKVGLITGSDIRASSAT